MREVGVALQDGLTSELRLAEASEIASANRVLAGFAADYNHRFARLPLKAATGWRPIPENLDRFCRFTRERIVSNDNVVQWGGQRLQIHPQPRRPSFAGAKVQLCRALDGRVSLQRENVTPCEIGVLEPGVAVIERPLG